MNRWRRGLRHGLAGALLSLVGCVSGPLGDDWDTLSPVERDARALAALEDLFDGSRRDVEHVDLTGIRYHTDEGPSHLRWEDVDSVLAQPIQELPGQPETIRVFIRQDSPSEHVADIQDPLLAKTGLVQRYVILRQRPRFSRLKLNMALDHVRVRRDQRVLATIRGVAPIDTQTPSAPAPPASTDEAQAELDTVELKLRELKRWLDEGLITPEQYEAKRAELLEGL